MFFFVAQMSTLSMTRQPRLWAEASYDHQNAAQRADHQRIQLWWFFVKGISNPRMTPENVGCWIIHIVYCIP